MNFDFQTVTNRRDTMSIKWAFAHHYLPDNARTSDPLPMWVADMDFKSPEIILNALRQEMDQGIFGYSQSRDSYDEAVTGWQERRFGWKVDPSWIIKTPGVVPAIAHIVQAFSSQGDGVLIQPPVYGPFHNIPKINLREVIEAPLVEMQDRYYVDLQLFEEVVRKRRPKLFILCNPHNPTGNVWTQEELLGMADVCLRYGVLIVSDEIHQDLIFDRTLKHIPLASLSPEIAANTITCTAPSKTFNVAGLQVSNLFISNPALRQRLVHQLDCAGHHFVNLLGMVACEAAYRHGEPWLEALLEHIALQHAHLRRKISEDMPSIRVFDTGSLYLAWVDFREMKLAHEQLQLFLLNEARVWFDSGAKFGQQGHGFARINLGCTHETLDEALTRLDNALNLL
jgi:cystathionine beta-lyase